MMELTRLYSTLTRLKEQIKSNQRQLEQYAQEEVDAKRAYDSLDDALEEEAGYQIKRLMMRLIGREAQYVDKNKRTRAEAYTYLQACTEQRTKARAEQKELVDEYDQLLDQLHRMKIQLSETSDAYKEKVLEAFKDRQEWRKSSEEIDEALHVGEIILARLDEALDALDSAKSWSTVDVLGGGFFTDVAKYNHIDHAEEIMRELEHALMRYRKELKDVSSDWRTDYEYLSDSHRLMDFLFDNIFTDVSNYQKIQDNLESLEALRGQMIDTQRALLKLRKEFENNIQRSLDLYDVNKYQS